MTTFFDNQIDLFDLDSAVSEPVEPTSADPKTSADWSEATVQKGKSLIISNHNNCSPRIARKQ